jgi:hypothetical protein
VQGGTSLASAPRTKGRKPLWSDVVAAGGKATVQIRMTEMGGAEKESNGSRLEKIREAIPGAKALLPHPRASDEVIVVVTQTTKDSLQRNVLKEGTEGMKLIRRPIQVMVLGVPFAEPITSRPSGLKCFGLQSQPILTNPIGLKWLGLIWIRS